MLDFDFAALERKLNEVSKKTGYATLDKSLEKGADILLNGMRKTVPVDTGELKKSLDIIKKSGSGMERQIRVGVSAAEREIIERGYYQEHGTPRIVAKKWMTKAAENSKEEALDAVINFLKDEISW